MPLIIKGGNTPTIISKTDMKNKLGKIKDEKFDSDPLNSLPHEVAEKRREVIDAKRHREFMARIQRKEEDAMRKLKEAEVEVTSEIVVDKGPDPIIISHDDVVELSAKETISEIPNFETMTKKELDEWAESALGLALDRRKKKADLIETIKKNL